MSVETWTQEAEKQLKSAEALQNISWESSGIKKLKPYYDSADVSGLSDQLEFFQNLPSHPWKLFQHIRVQDQREANKEALNALMGGCNGIIFEISEAINRNLLLKDIDLTICEISSFNQMIEGASGMHPGNCLQTHNAKGPVQQITAILDALNQGKNWVSRPSFSDFFLEIATIRALRFFLNTYHSAAIKIHTRVSLHPSTEHQWFLNTTGGLASILGGSYSIDLPTAEGDPRIARNVGNIIREESGISDYSDQCGGSYFVESLTHKIIQEIKSQR